MADKAVSTPAREGTVSKLAPAAAFKGYMLERAARESQADGSAVTNSQIDKILTAETDDDIWGADAGGTVQAQDAVGMGVEIHDMRAQESDRFEGSPYYVSMNAVCLGGPSEILNRNSVKVGENFVLQTGAELIVSKVRAFEARGRLPIRAIIVGNRTNSGYEVLKLGKYPEHVTPGTTE